MTSKSQAVHSALLNRDVKYSLKEVLAPSNGQRARRGTANAISSRGVGKKSFSANRMTELLYNKLKERNTHAGRAALVGKLFHFN